MALEGMLQIAYIHPELFAKFPQQIKDMSDGPNLMELWPYSDQLHDR
ncbi:hypothetical protein [Bifidobacterium bombi]|nr:hypothetical protein [Bifidobacterium bombi]